MASSPSAFNPTFGVSFSLTGPYDKPRGPWSVMPLAVHNASLPKPLLTTKYPFTATRIASAAAHLDAVFMALNLPAATSLRTAASAMGTPVLATTYRFATPSIASLDAQIDSPAVNIGFTGTVLASGAVHTDTPAISQVLVAASLHSGAAHVDSPAL